MKTTAQCPKCASRRIAVKRNIGGYYVDGQGRDYRDRYFCADCGLIETYYRTPQAYMSLHEDVRGIEKDWEWLDPPGPSAGTYR